MDGCDALPDAKAGRGECGDELECARLQHETGHENHRYPSLDEGVNGIKAGLFFTSPNDLEHCRDRFSSSVRHRALDQAAKRDCLSALKIETGSSVFTHSGSVAALATCRNRPEVVI